MSCPRAKIVVCWMHVLCPVNCFQVLPKCLFFPPDSLVFSLPEVLNIGRVCFQSTMPKWIHFFFSSYKNMSDKRLPKTRTKCLAKKMKTCFSSWHYGKLLADLSHSVLLYKTTGNKVEISLCGYVALRSKPPNQMNKNESLGMPAARWDDIAH